jgi:hypothetical protein
MAGVLDGAPPFARSWHRRGIVGGVALVHDF